MPKMSRDPAERFLGRAENYARFRPGYPEGVLDYLRGEVGLRSSDRVADVGCGTGKFAEILLRNGNSVVGIEPNGEMRTVAERLLAGYSGFSMVGGKAEGTGLEPASVDVVAAAQAFHWFEPLLTKAEFKRILKTGGKVILLWNDRVAKGSPFAEEFERLMLTFGKDYGRVKKRINSDPVKVRDFFSGKLAEMHFDNHQDLDLAGLKGRVASSSFSPEPEHVNFVAMMSALEDLFGRYESGGKITISYHTPVYWGALV